MTPCRVAKVLFFTLGWLSSSAGARELRLTVGEQQVLDAKGVTRVSLGVDQVVAVRILGNREVLLVGLKPGRTSLLIWRGSKKPEQLEVVVVGGQIERFKASCAELMGAPCTDLEIHGAGEQVVLSGAVRDLETYHKVRKLKKAFPEVVLLLEVEPQVLDVLVDLINQELKRAGLETARVTRVAQRLVLEGTVTDEHEQRKARLIVEAMYDEALGRE